jgi:hypothetical protein
MKQITKKREQKTENGKNRKKQINNIFKNTIRLCKIESSEKKTEGKKQRTKNKDR